MIIDKKNNKYDVIKIIKPLSKTGGLLRIPSWVVGQKIMIRDANNPDLEKLITTPNKQYIYFPELLVGKRVHVSIM